MRYPKLREIKEAIVSLFTKPYTTKFPFKPHKPFERFRGKPVVDDNLCVGCEACSSVCPTGAIKINDNAETRIRTITRDYSVCIFCGQCEANCITEPKAVRLSNEIFDLSTFDRKELIEEQKKELILCEFCGAVIGAKKHLEYIYKKLGPYAFTQQMTIADLSEKLGIIDKEIFSIPTIKDELKRRDFFTILCPNCKREVLLKFLIKD